MLSISKGDQSALREIFSRIDDEGGLAVNAAIDAVVAGCHNVQERAPHLKEILLFIGDQVVAYNSLAARAVELVELEESWNQLGQTRRDFLKDVCFTDVIRPMIEGNDRANRKKSRALEAIQEL